jgi:ornithine carbamoyltransferase
MHPIPKLINSSRRAKLIRSRIVLGKDFNKVFKDARVVYANMWHSMGPSRKRKEKGIKISGPIKSMREY